MQTEIIDVWINCPNEECAHIIAEACIDERLAACANVLPPIASIFRWNGNLEKAREIPLLLKTRADLFERTCERVRELHPYEVPAIAAMDLRLVNPAFAEWVITETQEI